MGLVSFNIMCANDLDKHTINWYTYYIGNKTMNKETIVTHIVMFLLGCLTVYMMVNYG